MRAGRLAGVLWAGVLAAGGCARGSAYPSTMAPGPEIERAARMVTEAQTAGADSLAADALATARKTLEEARQQQRGSANRAAIVARRAATEAAYARALAERELAQRARTEAMRAMDGLPPGGAR